MTPPTAEQIARAYGLRRFGREYRGRCPAHGGKSRPFSVTDGPAAPLFHCRAGCEAKDIIAAMQAKVVWPTPDGKRPEWWKVIPRQRVVEPEAPPRDWSVEAENIRQQIQFDHPMVRRYLSSRGIRVPAPSHCLGFIRPGIGGYHTAKDWPRMVAIVTDIITGAPVSLHFTALAKNGFGKAPIDPAKRLLAGHRKSGCVIRISPDDAVGTGLGLAEGIETALSVLQSGWAPIWSTIDAGNLGAFPVLDGIESLAIFADESMTGEKRATECADRWRAAGREAAIIMPPEKGRDWNDLAGAA